MAHKPVSIGPHQFPSLKAAMAYFKALLQKCELGAKLTGQEAESVSALLRRHTQYFEKVGPGYAGVMADLNIYNSRSFFALRTDGTREGFSYYHAICGKRRQR